MLMLMFCPRSSWFDIAVSMSCLNYSFWLVECAVILGLFTVELPKITVFRNSTTKHDNFTS